VDYVLCAILGLLGGGVGVGFKTVLYRIEDACEAVWRGRPEWLRPAVGGLVLGALLLAIPQMYGVGYPVMQQVIDGTYVLWFVVLLMGAKMVATSLTIGIGGSGGVFAPSLFMGACLGTAYGVMMQHLFGAAAGPVPAYSMVAMGAVFAGAARAPLTSTASVLEMTGDFGLVLPVMLGTALASALSARLSRGTIYTTKLLRRGTDIERTTPANVMQVVTVADTMLPLPRALARVETLHPVRARLAGLADRDGPRGRHGSAEPDTARRDQEPHYLFENETLEQALRQLVLYGEHGLPVVAEDGTTIVGWITNSDVLHAFARQLGQSVEDTEIGVRAAQYVEPVRDPRPGDGPGSSLRRSGYRLTSLDVPAGAQPAVRIGQLPWSAESLVVMLRRGDETVTPDADTELRRGDRLVVLAPVADAEGLASVREALAEGVIAPPWQVRRGERT
jgi:CIC family chloride channel protein